MKMVGQSASRKAVKKDEKKAGNWVVQRVESWDAKKVERKVVLSVVWLVDS